MPNGLCSNTWRLVHTQRSPTPSHARARLLDQQSVATLERQRKFLAAFAVCGNVTEAASTVPCGRETVWEWRQSFPAFAKLYADAHEDALDRLEEEARRRAVDGVLEPVVSAGKVVTTMRKYSSTLRRAD